MEAEEVLQQISLRLQQEGLPADAGPAARQRHLWTQLLDTEAKLGSSSQELLSVQTQQALEMKEVDNYVEHVRGLLQQRETLTAAYERENEDLRQEVHVLRQQQDLQSKELAELLAQEDLGDLGLSSPSEQVAYLLVERATLLERLEAAEQSPSRRDVQALGEEMSGERLEQQRLQRDLDEASSRLTMAHQDIRRLTGELDAAKSDNLHHRELELRGTVEEVEFLRKEVEKLKHSDMLKLQKVREESERLEAENRNLRGKVFALEAENKELLLQTQRNDPVTEDLSKHKDLKRCQALVEERQVQVRELERQIQKLRKQLEELEERNEELEVVVGEAQNASKEERRRHEGELEGLLRKVTHLEAELKKQDAGEKTLNVEEKTSESYFQMHLSGSGQERLALLEARLTEEKDWRKQLELDLTSAQTALKKDKEARLAAERDVKKLLVDVNGLQTECQQGKTLIKSLSQVKGEKVVLEEKVAQMERVQQRLQAELDRSTGAQQGALQSTVEQLQQKNQRLKDELSSLQTSHAALRDKMAAERQVVSDLQADVSDSVQKKLQAEGQTERLRLQVQRLSERQRPATNQVSDGCHSSDEHVALQALVSEAQAHIKSQDLVLGQKSEEVRQMKQDLQRVQNLFSSTERELRYEKEKNTDLKTHNMLLEQEKLKLSAELQQAQNKVVQLEQSVQACSSDLERQQQRVRDLELDLARNSVSRSAACSLQEELQAERERVIAADKKVLELQQQMKVVQQQLRLEEARAAESSRVERESRDLSDALRTVRLQQQQENISRKLLEQRDEELQQKIRSLRLKEATLTRTNAELLQRIKQLDSRLSALEAELSSAREQARASQTSCQRLTDELSISRQESERAQDELQQVLLRLDAHVRKYNDKQSQHQMKMRRAKHVFLRATSQRDASVQKLQHELALAHDLALKEKECVLKVLEENEKLLDERRKLLLKISEAEDMSSSGRRAASTVQHRVNVLEEENQQLRERTVKLSKQVSCLERSLRSTHTFNMEAVSRGRVSSEVYGVFQSSCSSYEDLLDTFVKVDPRPGGSRVSEQSYLNLTSPSVPDLKDTDVPEDE